MRKWLGKAELKRRGSSDVSSINIGTAAIIGRMQVSGTTVANSTSRANSTCQTVQLYLQQSSLSSFHDISVSVDEVSKGGWWSQVQGDAIWNRQIWYPAKLVRMP